MVLSFLNIFSVLGFLNLGCFVPAVVQTYIYASARRRSAFRGHPKPWVVGCSEHRHWLLYISEAQVVSALGTLGIPVTLLSSSEWLLVLLCFGPILLISCVHGSAITRREGAETIYGL